MPTTRSQTAQDLNIVAGSNDSPEVALVHSSHGQDPTEFKNIGSAKCFTNGTTWAKSRPVHKNPDEPPRFTINLSFPPEQRYLEVCAALKHEITGLTSLFDEVVSGIVYLLPLRWLHVLCRLSLRGVYNSEENAELKGISKATGVEMYLLVCFNVLLDLFMGCSSGGAAVGSRDTDNGRKMLHFRTLDWGMPALRRVVVQLDFVTETGGPVIASSITYAGFVGVLTGVRKDFSVSLNFRPNRNKKGEFWADALYVWHLILVLFGWRESICAVLRRYLLPMREDRRRTLRRIPVRGPDRPARWTNVSYEEALKQFQPSSLGVGRAHSFSSTPCYLCFSNGKETTVIEKDRITSIIRSSDDFIVITNNDEVDSSPSPAPPSTKSSDDDYAAALAEIVDEAKDRKQCAEHNWHNMKVTKAKRCGLKSRIEDLRSSLGLEDVVALVQKYPTTNECTHFACVMDPTEGVVSWCRRWMTPVGAKWIREHRSDKW